MNARVLVANFYVTSHLIELASFLIGYFVKKIVKILMFVLGGILALLIYMQSKGIINVEVNVDKIQSSTVDVINTILANTAAILPLKIDVLIKVNFFSVRLLFFPIGVLWG